MTGPGDDERSPPVDPDAIPDAADTAPAEAPQSEGESNSEADTDLDASQEPPSPEPETPQPKVAVGWGTKKPATKWERPLLNEQEEREPPPDVFDTTIRRSSRLHKDQVAAFGKLTKDIFELAESKRAKLALDPEVAAAFTACQTIRKGAKVRELRRISTMLRRFDGADLRARVDDLKNKDRATSERDKSYERWRDRLLEEGDAALSELVQAYPTADRQRIRQLVRTASRDRSQGKSRQAFRNLLREVRALDQATDADTEQAE
ncbi:MAG: ribosome biogenesis factor YjgA [Nannocystales bacterium]